MEGTLTDEEQRTLLHEVSVYAEGLMRAAAEAYVEEVAPDGDKGLKSVGSALSKLFSKASKILKTVFLAAALVLHGPSPMVAEERVIFAQQVVAQQVFLRNFQADVASGSQAPDGTLVARAGMYGKAAYPVGQNTNRGIMGLRGAVQERRILGAEDGLNCEVCPELADLGWQPFLSLPNLGETPCRMNCRCHFETRDASGKIRVSVHTAFAEKSIRHRLRGRHAEDIRQRHRRAGGSGHGYNPNRGPDGKFTTGPHHDERGVWRGRSDGPTIHAGTEQYTPARQAGVASYARQVGHEHGQDVRIAFTPPKHAKEASAASKAQAKDRHLVETTVEPKHRVETHGETTRHTVGGEHVAEVRRSDNGKHWVSRETIPGLPGEHSDFPYRSRAGAEKRANSIARASIREDTDRGYHAPKDLHEHFGKISGQYRSGIAETHTIRHRIITD